MKKNLDVLFAVLLFGAMLTLIPCAFGQQYDLGTQVDENTQPQPARSAEREARHEWSNGDILNDMPAKRYRYGKWDFTETDPSGVYATVECGLTIKYRFQVQMQGPSDFMEYTLPGPVTFDEPGVYTFYAVHIPQTLYITTTCPNN